MDAGQYVHLAEEKLKGGWFKCFAGERRFEEAAELYEQAANQYKLSKHWEEAADCLLQCAYCASKSGDLTAESGYYVEAGNVFKKFSTRQAVEQYELALSTYNASGKFTQGGKLLMTIAELFEGEKLEHAETVGYYRRAAEMFDLDEHGKSNFTKCNLKVAEYAAKSGRPEDRQEAIQIFEVEGERALYNSLAQFGAKEHFLNAGILHLVAGDSVSVNIAVEKYCSLDPRFAASREGDLLKSMAQAFESNDAELFLDAISQYDSVTKLDAWKTDQLLKVKEAMQPSGSGGMESVDLT